MDKLVVCHLAPFLGLVDGGIERSVLQQRKALDSQKRVEVVENPSKDFDVLHISLFDPISLLTLVLTDKKTVFNAHTTGRDFRDSMRFSNILAPIVDRFTCFFYDKADLVIVPSEYTKKVLQSKELSSEIRVVSNGIDTQRLEGDTSVEYDEDSFHVVNLGFVFERKGLSDFIEVAREMPETQFHWFGPQMDGFLSSKDTEEKIENSPDNVEFPGFVDDVKDAFEIADVFFFPTKEENQGISMLEAAYKEVPIVVRDIDTYRNWFIGEEHCLKADSVESFKKSIERLKNENSENLVRNSKELAEEHTLDNIGSHLCTTYEDVAEVKEKSSEGANLRGRVPNVVSTSRARILSFLS